MGERTITDAMSNVILVLNGPNLNLLGIREPEIYGSQTLDQIREIVEERAGALGLEVDFRQSNGEGELVTWIQEARGTASAIIINPAGYTQSSVSIHDALLAVALPVVAVHLSNIYRREAVRQHSSISRAAGGLICGFGATGYVLALEALAERLGDE